MGMKPRPKRRTWRWCSRNPRSMFVIVWVTVVMPEFRPTSSNAGGYFCSYERANGVSVCADEFRSLFGLNPKQGECIKVEFSGRVIE